MASVIIESCNLTGGVDAFGKGSLANGRARPGHVQRGDSAVSSPHEAVNSLMRIIVLAGDLTNRADASGNRALTGRCASARGVEYNNFGFGLWLGLRPRD